MSRRKRSAASATRSVDVPRLLAALRYLAGHPEAPTADVADAVGISQTTLHRLLGAAERDLDVRVTATRGNVGGMRIESWGLLRMELVLEDGV